MRYSSRFSLLPLEGGGAQRRRLASLSFAFSQPPPFLGKRVDELLIPLLPPSSGRRWRVAPEVGFVFFRLRPTPALRASPFRGKGVDELLIPLLPPSSGRRWRVAPEIGFALFRLQPTPTLRASPFHGKGVDRLLIPLLPPSSGRRWRVAPEVGFALFRFQPTPALRATPFHGKGGRWATHPASPSFLWKEVARSAGGWLRSLSPSAPPPFGLPPSLGRG